LRIDSHHSFSERYTLEYLESILKRNRFDGSVLVGQASMPVWSFPDFVRGVVVITDLGDPRLPYLLDEYQRDARFKGVCHYFNADIPDGLAELERRGIPLDALGPPYLVPRIVERFPSLRIVIDHVGQASWPVFDDKGVGCGPVDPDMPRGLSHEWARGLEQAAQSPQVYCKLSAIARLAPSTRPYVQYALAVFGPRRLMFGSDWPVGLPDTTWKASLAAFTQSIGAQTIEVREELLGGTAERFYGL
jgi:L-fuconolactonase